MDIKGFFDNVNHSKLLKQIWNLGIKDKALISIIFRLLKAEIEGEGIPNKGTPQGGILSPLLSNIVLNELDWWISDQWETFKTSFPFKTEKNKFVPLKKTNLKECFIVRYADDFKIICSSFPDAKRMYYATQNFLEKRLGLQISPEKSKVINLKKQSSEFLGIKIKALPKGKKHIAKSAMTEKAKDNAKAKIKNEIIKIQKCPKAETVWNFNSVVIQNYYKIATNITLDLKEINFPLRVSTYNRLKENIAEAKFENMNKTLQKRYKSYKPTLAKIQNTVLVPIYAQKHKSGMNFSQDISNYTVLGRKKIHDKLRNVDRTVLALLTKEYIRGTSIEYNDNRISKFIAQNGKCAITGIPLAINEIHCHHKKPREFGGNDKYHNLIIVHKDIHKLIHSTNKEKVKAQIKSYSLNKKQTLKFNNLRVKAHRKAI